MAVPPADCVVITERMPQALPLQPLPESDQERTAPGLEPGTGVSVATMAAVTPGWRLEGAASCSGEGLAVGARGEFWWEGAATGGAVGGMVGGVGGSAGGGGDGGGGGGE